MAALDGDDDATRTRQKRWRPLPAQKVTLEAVFEECNTPSRFTVATIASVLDVEPHKVRIWFQNRRQRIRKRHGPAALPVTTLQGSDALDLHRRVAQAHSVPLPAQPIATATTTTTTATAGVYPDAAALYAAQAADVGHAAQAEVSGWMLQSQAFAGVSVQAASAHAAALPGAAELLQRVMWQAAIADYLQTVDTINNDNYVAALHGSDNPSGFAVSR